MSDDDLLRLGLIRTEDGSFLVPHAAGMRLAPIGRYFEIQIAIGNGNVIKIVVPRVALKLVEGVRL